MKKNSLLKKHHKTTTVLKQVHEFKEQSKLLEKLKLKKNRLNDNEKNKIENNSQEIQQIFQVIGMFHTNRLGSQKC